MNISSIGFNPYSNVRKQNVSFGRTPMSPAQEAFFKKATGDVMRELNVMTGNASIEDKLQWALMQVAEKARINLPKEPVETVAQQLEEALPKLKELDLSTFFEVNKLIRENIFRPLLEKKLIEAHEFLAMNGLPMGDSAWDLVWKSNILDARMGRATDPEKHFATLVEDFALELRGTRLTPPKD